MNANEHDRRLEEVAAFALGALDADQIADFKEHFKDCKRCQDELRWLATAVRALPESVEQQSPPPALKVRLMEEVRADVAAEAKKARAAQRRERAESRGGFREWLAGINFGGLTWKPLAGMAAVILIVAAGIGYAVGNGGGTNVHTYEAPQAAGIQASVVREGDEGELRLAGLGQIENGKTLEAWVKRGETVEPVKMLFKPDAEGNATTEIEDLKGAEAVLVTEEPAAGSKQPTSEPFVNVPLET
jgi:type IV secretory pathway VirB2 component (pilin)